MGAACDTPLNGNCAVSVAMMMPLSPSIGLALLVRVACFCIVAAPALLASQVGKVLAAMLLICCCRVGRAGALS